MSRGFAKPSAFRVLLWKEWRQQRWTLAGMSALALALVVAGGCLEKRWSFGLSGAAYVFVLLGLPLVLSARAFAGEDEDGTAAFLRELPFRPLQVFAAKLLVVVLASWGAGSVLLAVGWAWPGYPDNAIRGLAWVPPAVEVDLPLVVRLAGWLVAPVTAALASLLASLGLRSLTTALLSGVCLLLCAWCWGVSLFFLGSVARARGFVWVTAAVVAPAVGILLAAGLSARRHPHRLVQFGRGAGGVAALAALYLVPGALSLLYLMVLVSPEAYVRPTWWRKHLGWVSVSVPPTARPAAVLLECELPVLGSTSLALLDPATGRTTRIERGMRCVPLDLREGCWSPDGSRVAWQRRDAHGLERCLVWLGIERSGSRWEDLGPDGWAPALFAYDLKAQRTTCVPHEAWDGLLGRGLHWWYDATTILRVTGRPGGPVTMSFVNTQDGSVHSCLLLPARPTATRTSQTVVLPGRAAFVALWRKASVEAAEDVVIARGTPDSAEADLLRVTEPPPAAALFQAVSPDGKWGLFLTADKSDRDRRLDLVDLGTGATRRPDLPPEVKAALALDEVSDRPILTAFVSDGRRLLVSTRELHAVYDPAGNAWQVYAPPSPVEALAHGDTWRPSPDGEHFLQYYRAGAGHALMARVFDLGSGRWTLLPLKDGYCGDVQWYGNDHVLALMTTGVWRFGLDGSRELLWPRE